MKILTVEQEGVTKVIVRADAMLSEKMPPGYSHSSYVPVVDLYAMSLIGPEQALRAIGAACAMVRKGEIRPTLVFTGPKGARVKARWAPRWAPRCQLLSEGVMHMVALPPLTLSDDLIQRDDKKSITDIREHVILAPSRSPLEPTAALRRAIYERLMLAYTTPLIPMGLAGQPPEEAAVGQEWCETLGKYIMDDTCWQPLFGHPEQDDTTWAHAGLLRISQEGLDNLVGEMVRVRKLRIPRKAAA